MVEVGSEIKGLKELAKNSDKLKKNFAGTTLRTALRNAAQPVRRRARAKVPVDEGDLREVYRHQRQGETGPGDGYRRRGLPQRPSILWRLHRAWARRPSKPSHTSGAALEDSEGEITDAFIGALNKSIEKALGGLN